MKEENLTVADEQLSLALIITILQDVLKRWYLILVVTLIAAMAAYVFEDYTYTPEYRTTTTFVASAAGTSTTTYQNLSAASNLASVFSEVLNSSLLRSKVMEQVGITHFDGTITASAVSETNLLTMTVRGSDPRTVFLMSKAIIEHHDIVSYQVLGNTVLEVLRQPTVPVSPTNPLNLKGTVMKAAMLAGVFMCALLAFISYRSDRIRSRNDADQKLGCRVLGELYHERKYKTLRDRLVRRKTSILITNPVTSFVYTEAVNKLAGRVEKRFHKDEKVLMVTSLMENEGKSTVAVNLALSLAGKKKRVLLIDCDLRKPACSKILGIAPQGGGTAEVLLGDASLENSVRKLENSGLYVLSCKRSIHTATNLVSSAAMNKLLGQAANLYDVVIVDTPPMSLAPDAECIAEYASAAMLVVKQNEASAGALNEAAEVLEKSGTHLIGCVLNNVYGSASYAPAFSYGVYGKYGRYGKYGKYGRYGKYGYGRYGYGYGRRAKDSENAATGNSVSDGENTTK